MKKVKHRNLNDYDLSAENESLFQPMGLRNLYQCIQISRFNRLI